MKCPQCKNEAYIDHVIREEIPGGVTETYVYVCMNPQCESYRKAFTLTGAEMESKITS